MPLLPDSLTNLKARGYVYRGLVGTAPLLVGYGLLSGEEAALWLACAASWLGVGVAAYNTPTKG
jgi:hypothetical protein